MVQNQSEQNQACVFREQSPQEMTSLSRFLYIYPSFHIEKTENPWVLGKRGQLVPLQESCARVGRPGEGLGVSTC